MKISLFSPQSIYEIGQRANQEDSVGQWDSRLFVLCDGMGGHEKGEVASQTVCQSLVTWFEEHINPEEPFTDEQLRSAIDYAYTEIDQYANGSPRQMGTTLTLLYIHRQGVTAAHIGDSRIYHIRPNSSREVRKGVNEGVLYQSRDHSLAFDLYQAGVITYEGMLSYPRKNVITRAVTPGKENRHRPDIIHVTDIQPGDYFFMCSDGMVEQMSNDELVAILSSGKSDEEKRQLLIAATANNQDNHSAWVIHVKDVVSEDYDMTLENEEPTARCNAIKIKPKPIVNDDVQIADDNDVVMVSAPKLLKKRFLLRPIAYVAIAVLLALLAVWFFFHA